MGLADDGVEPLRRAGEPFGVIIFYNRQFVTFSQKDMDLLAEIVALLQSPAKNVISALQSGGKTIAGLLKALEERAEG